jgi:hypothetical protein
MVDQSNSWTEYRRMILDWHEQDIQERKEIREKLEAYQKHSAEKLDAISDALSVMQTERGFVKYLFGIGLPALVALGVSWLGRKFGF